MTWLVIAVFWLAAVVFVAACVARIWMYARTPVHLRWELYPVPHEEPEKVRHGGSYFEDVDWWQRPRRKNLAGELAAMVPEILFLKGLWEFNRGLWLRSFPFHFGLYLLCGAGGLLLLTAVLSLGWPGFQAGAVGRLFHHVYSIAGAAGLVLGLVGAVGLLVRRLTDQTLRTYTSGWDLFNLGFFIVTFALLGVAHLVRGPGYQGPLALLIGVLSFRGGMGIPPLFAVAFVLLALLIAYVPLTHMSHFIGKYFTYHAVRWNDEPNLPGGELERRIAEALAYRPTWAAAHLKADGRRTWAEVATINPTREEG